MICINKETILIKLVGIFNLLCNNISLILLPFKSININPNIPNIRQVGNKLYKYCIFTEVLFFFKNNINNQ